MMCQKCGYDNKELNEDYCIQCKEPLSNQLKQKEEKIRAIIYNCFESSSINSSYDGEFQGWYFSGRMRRSMGTYDVFKQLHSMGYQIGYIGMEGRTITVLVMPSNSPVFNVREQNEIVLGANPPFFTR